jgi:hypothetical protein
MKNLVFVAIYIVILSAAFGAVSAAPWVPTKKKQRQKLLEGLDIPPGGTVYDLGCGDGTVLFDVVRKRPDVRAVGYEISLLPLFIGLIRKFLGGTAYRNVSLRFGNFFRKDVGEADALFLFLLEKSYAKLVGKLACELKDDCVVVTEAWPMPRLTPIKVSAGDRDVMPMYFYKGSQFRV